MFPWAAQGIDWLHFREFFWFCFPFLSPSPGLGAASTCSTTKHLQASPGPAPPSQTVLTLHQEMSTGHGATDCNPAWDQNPLLPFFLLICGAIYEEHTGPPVFPLHCFHLERGESLKNPNPDKAGRFFVDITHHNPHFNLSYCCNFYHTNTKNSRGSSNQLLQGSIFSAQISLAN